MQNILEMTVDKKLNLDHELNVNINNVKDNFNNIVTNIIDKGSNYIIKSLPINKNIKDILLDVKESFKTKDFKQILSTAINSSIREGLEFMNLPYKVINDLNNLKKVVINGGIGKTVSSIINMTLKNISKNNIFEPYIEMFSKSLQKYINSDNFIEKLDSSVQKVYNKIDEFNSLCNEWFKNYNEFNLEKINELSKTLNSKLPYVSIDLNCTKTNRLIQNITELVNHKKDKLSNMQLQICQNM